MKARECNEIFKVLKDTNIQTRILHPEKLFFKSKGEVKTFSDKKKKNERICCQ